MRGDHLGDLDDRLLPVARPVVDRVLRDVPVDRHVASEQVDLDEAVELVDRERADLVLADAAGGDLRDRRLRRTRAASRRRPRRRPRSSGWKNPRRESTLVGGRPMMLIARSTSWTSRSHATPVRMRGAYGEWRVAVMWSGASRAARAVITAGLYRSRRPHIIGRSRASARSRISLVSQQVVGDRLLDEQRAVLPEHLDREADNAPPSRPRRRRRRCRRDREAPGAHVAPNRSATAGRRSSRGSTSTASVAASDWAMTRAWCAPMLPAPTRAMRFDVRSCHAPAIARTAATMSSRSASVERGVHRERDAPRATTRSATGTSLIAHTGVRAVGVVVEDELRVVDAAADAALAAVRATNSSRPSRPLLGDPDRELVPHVLATRRARAARRRRARRRGRR